MKLRLMKRMAKKNKINNKGITTVKDILPEKIINSPETVPILFHEKKQELLKELMIKENTIIDLKNITSMNPGTIKRHLQDLVLAGLVIQTRTEKNIYGVNMKYYRASAKSFVVNLKWP